MWRSRATPVGCGARRAPHTTTSTGTAQPTMHRSLCRGWLAGWQVPLVLLLEHVCQVGRHLRWRVRAERGSCCGGDRGLHMVFGTGMPLGGQSLHAYGGGRAGMHTCVTHNGKEARSRMGALLLFCPGAFVLAKFRAHVRVVAPG